MDNIADVSKKTDKATLAGKNNLLKNSFNLLLSVDFADLLSLKPQKHEQNLVPVVDQIELTN